jgi:tetratricopeptide (TPR) repeat protein
MKHLLVGFVLTLTSVIAPPAFAEAPTSAEAAYEQGKAALKAGDTAGAIDAFKAGLGLAGADEGRRWQLILALGLSYDRAGEPAYAIESYQRFLDQTKAHGDVLSPKWRSRREMVSGDIKGLEGRVATTHGYVTVVTDPPSAAIFVGDRRAGANEDATSPAGFYLPVGEHVVSATLPDHERAESTITVGAGGMSPLRFALESTAKAAPTPGPVAPATLAVDAGVSATTEDEGSGSLGPWIVIASSGALAIAAGITAGLAAGARSDWGAYAATLPTDGTGAEAAEAYPEWESHRSTVESYEATTGALAAIAGAAAIGGLVWLLIADDDGGTPAVSVAPATGGLTGHAVWRF